MVAFFSFFSLCSSAGVSQSDAPVAKPDVKVGDRWKYRDMDYVRNVPRGTTYELRITFVGKDAIHALVTRPGRREADATYTSEWNAAVSPSGTVNFSERGLLQFPLQVGARYKVSWTHEVPARQITTRNELTVKVEGWEDVVVPAGKFRALRVEAEGTYRRLDGPYGGSQRQVFWYAPAAKRWVKFLKEESMVRYSDKFGEELVEFQVQ